MEITGRVTADAKINQLKDGKKVVNFSIAINDRYTPKGGEPKEVTTFINCAYWINAGIANYLRKGVIVELQGRIGVNAWINADGEAKGTIDCFVHHIKLHGSSGASKIIAMTEPTVVLEDDLPF